jgi:hypothetical protein
MSSENPYYASEQPPVASPVFDSEAFQPIHELDFGRMIKSPFQSPNWLVNLFWMFIVEILALFVVGNIVYLGYAGEVAIARSGGRTRNWPDFQLDRLTEYLLRGLWPFLWQMIGFAALSIVVGVPISIGAVATAALADGGPPFFAILSGVTTGAIGFLAMIAASYILFAVTLKSLLANDFMAGMDLVFVKSFCVNMVFTMLLAVLYFVIISTVATLLGALLCFVGLFLVSPILRLITCDFLAQIHDIHLSRGGPSAFPLI